MSMLTQHPSGLVTVSFSNAPPEPKVTIPLAKYEAMVRLIHAQRTEIRRRRAIDRERWVHTGMCISDPMGPDDDTKCGGGDDCWIMKAVANTKSAEEALNKFAAGCP